VGDATMVATAIARKMVPEFYRRNAAGEIEHAVATILGQMLEKPKLTVWVSELLRDDLSEGIVTLTEQRGFAGRVTVTADPKMHEGDCRVEWAGGGGELNSAARWREIDAIIERNLGGVPTAVADDSDHTETNEAPAGDTIAESGGGDPSHQELEDDHG
jgi:flagellar assembly protein FliH